LVHIVISLLGMYNWGRAHVRRHKLLTINIVCYGVTRLFYIMQERVCLKSLWRCVHPEARYDQLLRTWCKFQPCTYILMCTTVPYP